MRALQERRGKPSVTPPPEFTIPVGLRLTAKAESRLNWHLTLDDTGVLEKCRRCNTVYGPKRFKPLGPRVTHPLDLPIGRKAAYLTVSRNRFSCVACGHVFCLPVRELDEGRRGLTSRLVHYLKARVLESPPAELVTLTHVSIPTLTRLATELILELDAMRTIDVPRFLGVFSCVTPRCEFGFITNAETGTLIDFLPDAGTDTLGEWFQRLGSRTSTIETVQIELCEAHRSILYNSLPGVQLVASWSCIDKIAKSLLMQSANRLGTMGWTVRRKLERDGTLLQRSPGTLSSKEKERVEFILKRDSSLRLNYELTHKLGTIRAASSRAEALSYYREWRNLIPATHVRHFEPVLSTLEEWDDQLLDSLSLPQESLDHADGIRHIVREVNRNAAGYSFQQLRGRMLFSKQIQQRISRLALQTGRKTKEMEA